MPSFTEEKATELDLATIDAQAWPDFGKKPNMVEDTVQGLVENDGPSRDARDSNRPDHLTLSTL